MATLFTLSITDPGLEKKSAEAAYVQHMVAQAMTEFARARGNTTSGTILASGATVSTGPASQGSWTYTTNATKP